MAFAALLSFAPAIILLQFCFNPLYKIYSLECISEPAFFSLKYIKYCISCITVYTYTIKTAERFSVPPRLSKNPGELEKAKALSNFQSSPAACTVGAGLFYRREIPFPGAKIDSFPFSRPEIRRILAKTGKLILSKFLTR